VYQVETEDYMMLDKHWGKQLSFQEFGLGIEKFFCNGRRTRRRLAGVFPCRPPSYCSGASLVTCMCF
jgi:hypothetical protein